MAKHIIMAVTNDLATDQRVGRTSAALHEAGFAVTLVGRRLKESPRLASRQYKCVRMRLLFRRSALFYANDSDTLLACCWAARLRRKPLAFDAHELFPDVPELVGKPAVRRVWRWVESWCLPYVTVAFTVSRPVAEAYGRRYGIVMKVLRNVPVSSTPLPTTRRVGEKTMLLYQGAVNVGRGVRELIDVMNLLPDCRLTVAGDGDLLDELKAYAAKKPWGGRIEFLGRVTPERLHKITREADLGLCLLEELGLSYQCALPNRIGDFIHAGVPILATGFEAIREVLEHYGVGTVTEACPHVKEGQAYEAYINRLADTISTTLTFWREMPGEEKVRRFAEARRELCWENEKKILLEAVDAKFKRD